MSGTGRPTPPEDVQLADALSFRALQRTATSAAVGGCALLALAVLFLLMTGGVLADTNTAQTLILVGGNLTALALGAGCQLHARRIAADPGSGPDRAAAAHRWIGWVFIADLVLAALVTAATAVPARPVAPALLSAAIGTALLGQLLIVLSVNRKALRRAALA